MGKNRIFFARWTPAIYWSLVSKPVSQDIQSICYCLHTGTFRLDTRDLLVAGVPISISSKYLYLYLALKVLTLKKTPSICTSCHVNPRPAASFLSSNSLQSYCHRYYPYHLLFLFFCQFVIFPRRPSGLQNLKFFVARYRSGVFPALPWQRRRTRVWRVVRLLILVMRRRNCPVPVKASQSSLPPALCRGKIFF